MTMHEPDSRIRVNARPIVMSIMLLFVMVMLWWMYEEQDKVHQCTQKMMMSSQQQQQIMASQLQKQDNRPIQVIVQNPFGNLSSQLFQRRDNVNNTPAISQPAEPAKWNYNWDKLQWKDPKEAQGVPARTIVLIRHGQYDFKTGLLNDNGKQQANITGQRLKAMGMKFTRVIHSTMPRARQTAEIISPYLAGVDVTMDPVLEEGGPKHPDPTISYWGLPDRKYHVDGPRLESAFRKYFHRADKLQKEQSFDLLVGHANIFRFFILRALQVNPSAWMRIFISHGSITLLHINSDSTVSMTRCGDSGHFPPKLVTF